METIANYRIAQDQEIKDQLVSYAIDMIMNELEKDIYQINAE